MSVLRPPSPDGLYLHAVLRQHVLASQAHAAPGHSPGPGSASGSRPATALRHDLPPSCHPPAAFWSPQDKARLFPALARHSRLRPDLIAHDVGSKSPVDVAVYLDLLRQGLDACPAHDRLPRARFPIAHDAPDDLVDYEDEQAARAAHHEPVYAAAAVDGARAAEQAKFAASLRAAVANGDRVARRVALDAWKADREKEWARDDVLACLDDVQLAVFDRILREDEEKAAATTTTGGNDADVDCADADGPNENTTPAERRRLYKRMYMRRKRAEKAGVAPSTAAARLKPGRRPKADPPPPIDDSDSEHSDRSIASSSTTKKPNKGGLTRPYRFRRTLDALDVDAAFLRDTDLGLFHHAPLARLTRLHSELDGPPGGTTADAAPYTLSADVLRYLGACVTHFVRRAAASAIRVREADFRLKRHTKVWRLGRTRRVLARHVQAGLEVLGHPALLGARAKHAHFARMAARVPVPGEVEDDAEPAAPRAIVSRPRKKRRDAKGKESDGYRWPDRKMAEPLVLVPDEYADAVPETYPFGIDARGTRPVVSVVERRARDAREQAAREDVLFDSSDDSDDDSDDDEEGEEEAALDAADVRASRKAVAAVMRELGLEPRTKTTRARKRAREQEQEHEGAAAAGPARKRARFGAESLAERQPDGVLVKSAVYVEDSDED